MKHDIALTPEQVQAIADWVEPYLGEVYLLKTNDGDVIAAQGDARACIAPSGAPRPVA